MAAYETPHGRRPQSLTCAPRNSSSPTASGCRNIAGCLLLLACCGCGTSEYERRLTENVGKLQAASPYQQLYAPQDLEGVPVSIRIPRIFTDPPLIEGRGAADPRRIKPMIVTIPGLKLTYEGTVKDTDGGMLRHYLYVGVIGKLGGRLSDPMEGLRRELGAKPEFTKLTDWTDFLGETPEGRGNNWKKLRFESDQDFLYTDKMGKDRYVQMPGVLEIYVQDQPEYYITLGCRMPKSVENNVGVAKWAPLVAGCVSLKP